MEIKVIKCDSFEEFLNNLINGDFVNKDLKKRLKEIKTPRPNRTQREALEVSRWKMKVIESIAKKKGWDAGKTNDWLINIYRSYPMIGAKIVLYEFSRLMDQKYEGLITKCPHVYGISELSGKVVTRATKAIKSFRNVAAFRTREDAILAKKVAGIRKIFRNAGK